MTLYTWEELGNVQTPLYHHRPWKLLSLFLLIFGTVSVHASRYHRQRGDFYSTTDVVINRCDNRLTHDLDQLI